MQHIQTLHPKDLNDLPKDAIILDVRTPAEHAAHSLSMAHILVPLDTLTPDTLVNTHGVTKKTPLYVLCGGGGRATHAAGQLMDAGFESVFVIEGGLRGCEAYGHSTCSRSQDTIIIPMEGQVRIGIGGLIILLSLFALMGLGVLLWLMLLVGIALVVSGFTGFCALANLLYKAPWNKGSNNP